MIDAAIWLLRWTLAGAALGAVVVAAAYVFERKGRAVSLGLFRATLLAALAAPVVALVPPVFTFSGPGSAYVEPDSLVPRFIEKPDSEPAGNVIAAAPEQKHSAPRAAISADAIAGALLALWITGVALAAISRQRSHSRLAQAFHRGTPFPAPFIECRLSADAPTPLIFGVFRPRMLAPEDFCEWPAAEREAVLRHEAAHARRGDLVWAFLGDVVRTLYWWAPPVRFLVSRHILATEEACDAVSFSRSEDRHDYARTLIAVARRVGGHASPGLAMTASSLRRRIERLTNPETRRGLLTGFTVLAAGAAAAFTLALTEPAAAAGKFRIYIFNPADDRSSTYAASDGQRATAAIVEQCVGRLLPNAVALVDEMEARLETDDKDKLSVVWVVGPGSETEFGPCHKNDERASDHDSLVLITDASERQARKFIREIHGLSGGDREQMAAELGIKLR
jgi:beta-lactamase regulating signal transducer with metallopeptidase domain